jgi:hypothetical protein
LLFTKRLIKKHIINLESLEHLPGSLSDKLLCIEQSKECLIKVKSLAQMISWQIVNVDWILFKVVERLEILSNAAVVEIVPNNRRPVSGSILIEFQEVFYGEITIFVIIIIFIYDAFFEKMSG